MMIRNPGSLDFFDAHQYEFAWATGWNISVADFDADGKSDLFLYNPANGQFFKALNNTSTLGTFTYVGGTWASGWQVNVVDINGDLKSDVLLYNAGTGRWAQAITGNPQNDFTYFYSDTSNNPFPLGMKVFAGGWK
jgi:hypothetical protein